VGDVKVLRVLQARDKAARKHALVGHDEGSGQMLGVAVDGETKQQQLDDGHAYHHAEGQAVAANLADLLDQDGEKARPAHALAPVFSPAKLSCASCMSAMNTSSRLGAMASAVSPAKGSAVSASCTASVLEALTCSVMPKGATLRMPAVSRRWCATSISRGPETAQVTSPAPAITSAAVPRVSSLPYAI